MPRGSAEQTDARREQISSACAQLNKTMSVYDMACNYVRSLRGIGGVEP